MALEDMPTVMTAAVMTACMHSNSHVLTYMYLCVQGLRFDMHTCVQEVCTWVPKLCNAAFSIFSTDAIH